MKLALLLALALGCAKLPPPAAAEAAVNLDGRSARLDAVESNQYLHYAVGRSIAAPPVVVWAVLTDAGAYTRWNSTIVSLEGKIAAGEQIVLVAKISPKRPFKLKVSTFEPETRMVWEDGNDSFRGVRTFTLAANATGGTDWTMKEAFSGKMMGMIAPKLPDFTADFEAFAKDLATEAEKRAASP